MLHVCSAQSAKCIWSRVSLMLSANGAKCIAQLNSAGMCIVPCADHGKCIVKLANAGMY